MNYQKAILFHYKVLELQTKMLFNHREQWYILQDVKISYNKNILKATVSVFFVICLLVAYPWCKKL